jgi:hypothetical protein
MSQGCLQITKFIFSKKSCSLLLRFVFTLLRAANFMARKTCTYFSVIGQGEKAEDFLTLSIFSIPILHANN